MFDYWDLNTIVFCTLRSNVSWGLVKGFLLIKPEDIPTKCIFFILCLFPCGHSIKKTVQWNLKMSGNKLCCRVFASLIFFSFKPTHLCVVANRFLKCSCNSNHIWTFAISKNKQKKNIHLIMASNIQPHLKQEKKKTECCQSSNPLSA